MAKRLSALDAADRHYWDDFAQRRGLQVNRFSWANCISYQAVAVRQRVASRPIGIDAMDCYSWPIVRPFFAYYTHHSGGRNGPEAKPMQELAEAVQKVGAMADDVEHELEK
jgi:hypothetical protein